MLLVVLWQSIIGIQSQQYVSQKPQQKQQQDSQYIQSDCVYNITNKEVSGVMQKCRGVICAVTDKINQQFSKKLCSDIQLKKKLEPISKRM